MALEFNGRKKEIVLIEIPKNENVLFCNVFSEILVLWFLEYMVNMVYACNRKIVSHSIDHFEKNIANGFSDKISRITMVLEPVIE